MRVLIKKEALPCIERVHEGPTLMIASRIQGLPRLSAYLLQGLPRLSAYLLQGLPRLSAYLLKGLPRLSAYLLKRLFSAVMARLFLSSGSSLQTHIICSLAATQ
eukprot:1160164-Pelagomonas_calceolata.AAC.4